jgi:hypothetical protein
VRRIDRMLVLLVSVSGACNTSKTDETPAESTGAATTSTTDPVAVTTESGTADGSADESSSEGVGDTGSIDGECSVWEQDCAMDEKCAPWSLQPDLVPDDVRCCPVVDNPKLAGEECSVEDYFGSCLDDCALGSICLDTDNDGAGVCQAFCTGVASNPQCGANEGCLIYFSGVPFCFPKCDPLVQNCPDGQGCYPSEEAVGGTDFLCLPHIGVAQLGGPCWLLSNCDPGLVCVTPEFFPGCTAPKGCCTPLCDVTEPGTCDEVDEALDCVSWYVGGQQPPSPELENVGVCVIPP